MQNFIKVHNKGKSVLVNMRQVDSVSETDKGTAKISFAIPKSIYEIGLNGKVESMFTNGMLETDEAFEKVSTMIAESQGGLPTGGSKCGLYTLP